MVEYACDAAVSSRNTVLDQAGVDASETLVASAVEVAVVAAGFDVAQTCQHLAVLIKEVPVGSDLVVAVELVTFFIVVFQRAALALEAKLHLAQAVEQVVVALNLEFAALEHLSLAGDEVVAVAVKPLEAVDFASLAVIICIAAFFFEAFLDFFLRFGLLGWLLRFGLLPLDLNLLFSFLFKAIGPGLPALFNQKPA